MQCKNLLSSRVCGVNGLGWAELGSLTCVVSLALAGVMEAAGLYASYPQQASPGVFS